MKYLSEGTNEEIIKKVTRFVEYVRCDLCNKIILADTYRSKRNRYMRIHTCHNDWGNDSIDSHAYKDLCPTCAEKFISEYIRKVNGSEELELETEYVFREKVTVSEDEDDMDMDEGYELCTNDHEDII